MNTQLYRLRSTRHLLGDYNELRDQYIYLAKPDELNDPMEGFRDIVWKGDDIVWTNLFRHYISCLNLTIALVKLQGNDVTITPNDIPIEGLAGEHPPPMETTILDELCTLVFEKCRLHQLIHDLSSSGHPVRRDELLIYLKYIHFVTIDETQNLHVRYGITPRSARSRVLVDPPQPPANIPVLIQRLHEERPDITESAIASLLSASSLLFDNLNLMKKYDTHKQNHGSKNSEQLNRELILLDFPKAYVSQLMRILYPKWYVACFLEDCTNSSVWGHYGDNHRGAALIFNTSNNSGHLQLELKHIVGFSGGPSTTDGETSSKLTWRYSPMEFHRVRYQKEIEELDFFRSIGVLPVNRLIERWYTNQAGDRSKCADHIAADSEASWRELYWKSFLRDISIKSEDWSYEKEFRLILNSSLVDLDQPSTRQLTYKFESLGGIVFGINMSDEDKISIIDIILTKCQELKRTAFDFFQAYYSHETGSIEKQKLNIKIPH